MKRIRLLFLMLLCVAGTALTARAQKVTLNFRNAKLEQVFGRITEQTGYTFYYARPTVNPDKVVSIAVADVDVRAALKQLLADDKVAVKGTVSADMMEGLTAATYPTLTVSA